MSGEQDKTVPPYIKRPRGMPRKRLSTFSTVEKYTTQDRRRTMPSNEIHNTNTNRYGNSYIELMFVITAK